MHYKPTPSNRAAIRNIAQGCLLRIRYSYGKLPKAKAAGQHGTHTMGGGGVLVHETMAAILAGCTVALGLLVCTCTIMQASTWFCHVEFRNASTFPFDGSYPKFCYILLSR